MKLLRSRIFTIFIFCFLLAAVVVRAQGDIADGKPTRTRGPGKGEPTTVAEIPITTDMTTATRRSTRTASSSATDANAANGAEEQQQQQIASSSVTESLSRQRPGNNQATATTSNDDKNEHDSSDSSNASTRGSGNKNKNNTNSSDGNSDDEQSTGDETARTKTGTDEETADEENTDNNNTGTATISTGTTKTKTKTKAKATVTNSSGQLEYIDIDDKQDGLSGGTIGGIVVGALFLSIGLLVVFLWRRNKQRQRRYDANQFENADSKSEYPGFEPAVVRTTALYGADKPAPLNVGNSDGYASSEVSSLRSPTAPPSVKIPYGSY